MLYYIKKADRVVFVADFSNFLSLDIRAGTIIGAEVFKKAKKPAYKLEIDFGEETGIQNPLRR